LAAVAQEILFLEHAPSRAFVVLLFFMGDFVFLIFIMAQPDGQMLSM